MIKSFSVVAMAALVFVGCNSGGTDNGAKAATLADAKKLAQSIGTGPSVGEAVGNLGTKNLGTLGSKSRSVVENSCPNGGSMIVNFDENQFTMGQIPTSMNMSMQMNNCNENGEITNGKMNFKLTNLSESMDNMHMTISFPTKFTVTVDGKTATIDAGGSMGMHEEPPYTVMTINMMMHDGSESFGGKNLVYKMKDNNDGSSEIFPASGEENFGTGVYFKVDPSYDASKTPMVTDDSGVLQVGGLFKYLDGANHKVEVEATATNEVTVWVDENGNGSHDAGESEVVSVAN